MILPKAYSDHYWSYKMELEKSMRLNILFDFYRSLLTSKQDDYLELYYADDYSLGEIADEFSVSRQAVYDNLKRSTQLLENYENKLHLYAEYLKRQVAAAEIETYIKKNYQNDQQLIDLMEQLITLEED